MEHLINKQVQDIQISGIRKFFNLVTNYKDAVSLTIGQPDFPTPQHIKDAGKAAIDLDRTTYTQNAGLPELRNAVSGYMQRKYGLDYSPENEIIITNGASEAIDITLRTILEEGSEVILPGPVYPGYEPIIKLCRAIPVYIDTGSNGFRLNAELLKKSISDKTRCIILPYPSNPTGCIMDRESLTEIAELMKDKDIFIVSDEIYSELIYEGVHISPASFTELRNKTIVINGLSKSHSMTGWRIGFTLAPSFISKHMLKVHQYNATCACTISQFAALEALTQGFDDSDSMRREYLIRRNYTYDRLLSMGLEVVKPSGAFYIFPSIKKFNLKSFEFAYRLLDTMGAAVVPGDAFSEYGEGYIRISYAYSMEVLEEGLSRLERFIETLIV